MLLHRLAQAGVAHPPKWLPDNTAYLTDMGSVAYGVSSDNSDQDIYGFCLPPKELTFPWLSGEIPGFGTQLPRFNDWSEHHIRLDDKEYDFAVFSIVRYFHLCMDSNPNMVDSLFTPDRCVRHITDIGTMTRDRRKVFLSKLVWHKFKGYAYQQVRKMDIKRQEIPDVIALREYADSKGIDLKTDWPTDDSAFTVLAEPVLANRRHVGIAKYGFDVKFAYHVVRLMGEVQQILEEGDLDIERNREQLKAIRRGEWSKEDIQNHFAQREMILEKAYAESNLPHKPNEGAIKALLLECLEHHYGSISTQVMKDTAAGEIITAMQRVIDQYKG